MKENNLLNKAKSAIYCLEPWTQTGHQIHLIDTQSQEWGVCLQEHVLYFKQSTRRR